MSLNKVKHKEPEIFLQSFELVKLVIQSLALFPKPTRYVLGYKLEMKSLDFLLKLNELVGPSGVRFQSAEGKRQVLVELSYSLDEFRVLLRMAREVGAYSAGQYQDFVGKTQSIGRQIGGLLRRSREGKG